MTMCCLRLPHGRQKRPWAAKTTGHVEPFAQQEFSEAWEVVGRT